MSVVPARGRVGAALALLFAAALACGSLSGQSPAGPVIVLDTARGIVEIETFPVEAPKSVAHVLELVKNGFYDGQRVHLVRPDFIVQFGDPLSRDPSRRTLWGRHAGANSGEPIGIAELSRKYTHVRGTVGLAHTGDPKGADSQLYITLSPQPQLDGAHAVIGRVVQGDDVLGRLVVGDVIRRAWVREPGEGS